MLVEPELKDENGGELLKWEKGGGLKEGANGLGGEKTVTGEVLRS